MTDQHLRELARRARETGSVEDEAAYLIARVRAGELDEDRLHIAAYCGHEPAIAAVGPAVRRRAKGLREWLHGLQWWGAAVAVRGFAEACDAWLSSSCTVHGFPEQQLEELVARVRSNSFPSDDRSVFPHAPQAMALFTAVQRQREQPHYANASDPEIVNARSGLWRHLRRGDDLVYNHTQREAGVWRHFFLHVRRGHSETWRGWAASPGWTPPAGSFRCPPDRRGIFDRSPWRIWEVLPGAWPAAEDLLRAWASSSGR